MKKTVLIVLFFMLSIPVCKVNADSCGYIVKFNSDEFIADNRFEKIFDNTYHISNLNYLYRLEDLIDYVEPDDEVELVMPIETNHKNRQLSISQKTETINWQAEMIKANFAWDLATFGNGVNVAVIDSVCNKHIDLGDNLAGGYNYILDTDDYSDNIGRGTHVAEIIAAAHNDFGIMGIAPKTKIFDLKCFDSDCETTVSMIAKAIKSAVDDYDCKIINMSLGLKNDRETLHEAIQYATKKGAAILLSADSGMSLQRFKELIISCSEDLGDHGYDTEYGYRLLDIQGMFDAIIDDYYVSPINDDGVVVYNNTDDELSAIGIWSEYADDQYIDGLIAGVLVAPKEKVNIPLWKTENDLQFFLWESVSSMIPLTKYRRVEANAYGGAI